MLSERGLQPASMSICKAMLKRRERRAPHVKTLPHGLPRMVRMFSIIGLRKFTGGTPMPFTPGKEKTGLVSQRMAEEAGELE